MEVKIFHIPYPLACPPVAVLRDQQWLPITEFTAALKLLTKYKIHHMHFTDIIKETEPEAVDMRQCWACVEFQQSSAHHLTRH